MITISNLQSDALRDDVIGFLKQHAETVGHPFAKIDVSIEARDGEALVGGLIGKITQTWMYVELLGVDALARGQGWGQKLMEAAEAEARARALTGIWVDTYTFQAPDFYRSLGFEEFGRIDDYPEGHARVFFRKKLA